MSTRPDSIIKLLADNFCTESSLKGLVILGDECIDSLLGCFPGLSLHCIGSPGLPDTEQSHFLQRRRLTGYPPKEVSIKYPSPLDKAQDFYDFAIIGSGANSSITNTHMAKLCFWQRISIGGLIITDLDRIRAKVELGKYNGLRWARKVHWIACSGCFRSGTMYISRTLNAVGFKVGHQQYRKDGISGGCVAPCIFPSDTVTLHQIRHPVDNIRSLVSKYIPNIAKYARRFIPITDADSPLLIAMKYWYYWNKMAEARNYFIFRLEDMADAWDDISRLLNTQRPFPALRTNIHANKGPRPEITWSDILREDEQLAMMIKDMAKRYGYNIESSPKYATY